MNCLRLVRNDDEIIILNSSSKLLGHYCDGTLEFGGRWYTVRNGKVKSNSTCLGIPLKDKEKVYIRKQMIIGLTIRQHEILIAEAASATDKVLMIINELQKAQAIN